MRPFEAGGRLLLASTVAEREFVSAEVFADGRRVFLDAANLPVDRCGGDACGTQSVAFADSSEVMCSLGWGVGTE